MAGRDLCISLAVSRLVRGLHGLLGFALASDALCPPQVLIDVNMPVMNGFETLSRMKSSQDLWHIPVILMSSDDKAEDGVFTFLRLRGYTRAAFMILCNLY